MYKYEEIKVVHLEPTQRCQAACPMCDRNKNGEEDNQHLTYSEIFYEDAVKIFDQDFIKNLKKMYMCGNLGDPIFAKDCLEIFQYFRKNNNNIQLSMNTNGGARSKEWWAEIAKTLDYVIFSIDGLEDTNHIYRQNVNWNILMESVNSFIKNGGNAVWDFIVFKHNEHQIEKARELAQKLGFKKFVIKKTGRFFSNVRNQGKDEHDMFYRKEKKVIKIEKPSDIWVNDALKKEKFIIEKFGSLKNYYNLTEIDCKVKKEKNIFITAEGYVLPCCWTAGRMYKWYHKDYRKEQIWRFIDAIGKERINAKIYSLKEILDNTDFFENIEKSWSKSSIENGKLEVCAQKCGILFDQFSSQYL
ncbi:MAG: radical SAM protein [Candidatus Dojkabacteria bacterium]|nr:radical SAM protein [Candidatus Dojkabacteria bacterium]